MTRRSALKTLIILMGNALSSTREVQEAAVSGVQQVAMSGTLATLKVEALGVL